MAKLPANAPDSPKAEIHSAVANSAFFAGTLEAHRRSTLTPKVSSTVTRVHVRDGDQVKEGQPLVTLDTQDFALRTQQAEAALQAAKVQLDLAKLEWTRTKALLADKAVPQSQFDMLDARYKGAEAGVAQAETAVAMGRKALRDAILRAPFHGLVVKRLVNEGEYASVMPATPMVILEEVNPIDLRIQLPSTEMDKVKKGTLVRVRFPATGQSMDLELTRIVAAMDPRSRTFSAIVEIPNPDYSLRTGLYADVTLSPKNATQTTPVASAKNKKAIRAKKD
jgi:membrane fusion protein (multidrug efflux system)